MSSLPVWGTPHPDLDPARLRHGPSRELLAACLVHPDYTVRELRHFTRANGTHYDAIVVECDNRQVPVRNPAGICAVEPLLLIYTDHHHAAQPYEVRALRADFPLMLHQNAVPDGEPVSLCLYELPWSHVRRTWTPARFLDRVLEWLARSAEGTLHEDGQPLEELFYLSPRQLVLPADFESAWVTSKRSMRFVAIESGDMITLRPVDPNTKDGLTVIGLALELAPIGHPPLSRQPVTLGALVDLLQGQGTDLVAPLKAALQAHWPEGSGALLALEQRTVLFLQIPRVHAGVVVRTDAVAVFVEADPGTLGLELGVLDRNPDNKHVFRSYSTALSGHPASGSDHWRAHAIDVLKPRYALNRAQAQGLSGLSGQDCEFRGVLAGVGALGSSLFNIWHRIGWGNWTLVDDDIVLPHNLTRHTVRDHDTGFFKVSACAEEAVAVYPAQSGPTGIPACIDAAGVAAVSGALTEAQLVVDATATLGAPRELSHRDYSARTVSTFFSPSGQASVMLMEDATRDLRLLALEAQYYRAVLRQEWGRTHLQAPGSVRTGGSCRDVSLVLSLELVQLHAAILARQVRVAAGQADARISVWTHEADGGGVTRYDVPVLPSRQMRAAGWTIGWDAGIEAQLRAWRAQSLPAETGGILLGIVDTVLKTIQVVDVLPAPQGSEGSPHGFIRVASQTLLERVRETRERTGNAVDYVGEWHSHPDGCAVAPSDIDLLQLASLSERLGAEGLPAMVAIVGEDGVDLSWSLGRLAALGAPH